MSEETICKECGGRIITDTRHSERYCRNCGVVYEENMNGEKKQYDNDNKPVYEKLGKTDLIHDNGLGSVTNFRENSQGMNLSQRTRLKRLYFAELKESDYKSRIMKDMIRRIMKHCGDLNLSKNSMNDISKYFKKSFEKGITKGRNSDVILASVIYLICRRDEIPVGLWELEKICGVLEKQIAQTYRLMKVEFDMNFLPMPLHKLTDKVSNLLGVPFEDKKKAFEMAREVELCGRNPWGVAGACVYIATDGKKSMQKISGATGVSNQTISRVKDVILEKYTTGLEE